MSDRLFDRPGSANVLTMPAGAPFLTVLAKTLRDSLGDALPDALILLPTRRAVRELGEAFVAGAKETGHAAALLPMMRPLADVDPEEPPFEPGDLAHTITPAIDSVRRRFELSNLVLAKEARLRQVAPDAAGALALTEPLLTLLDDSFMEELTPLDLKKLDDMAGLSAAHYEQAGIFFKIIAQWWPEYLADNNLMDPMQRRVALLRALADQWRGQAPSHPVIIAGSTGTLAATADLISVVSRLPKGAVILPGLDRHIDEDAVWSQIGPEHPQGSMKNLLETIGVDRKHVRPVPGFDEKAQLSFRRRIISEALIPADETADWRSRITRIRDAAPGDIDPFIAGLKGLSLIEAKTGDEEASAIALVLRESLETPGKTAALVTPDPQLGRRVAAKLTRWSITVDVSAGQPLEETPVGAWLSWVLNLAADPWDPVALAAVFKHRLTAMGEKPGRVRRLWEALERAGFHGPRNDSIAAIKRRHLVKKGDFSEAIALIETLHKTLAPLTGAFDAPGSAAVFARLHCTVAERLSASIDTAGSERLWRGEDGEAAHKLISDLLAHGDILGDTDGPGYARLLAGLMRGRVVRPKSGTEPRLHILGPLEARMLSFDTLILGGLNEGVWPAPPAVDPILSYGMREVIKLSSPERRFGLAAHDFAQLAAQPRVILTRAARTDDGPAVASRWIWRLKTLLQGALGSDGAAKALAPPEDYLGFARALDFVPAEDVKAAERPAPRPPAERRWPNGRRVSVTQVETWTRDPYAIFARKVLGLDPLDPLDADLGPREYGTAIHRALELFIIAQPDFLTKNASDVLAGILREQLITAGYPQSDMARETGRLDVMARRFVDWERARRAAGYKTLALEKKGKWTLHPRGCAPFTLSAEADRIDLGPDGFSIVDYKTGAPPSDPQVLTGFNAQLALEAAMIEAGAFKDNKDRDLPEADIAQLLYVRPRGGKADMETRVAGGKKADPRALTAQAYEGMMQLIAAFDDPATPYPSQPRAQFNNQNKYGDFDHLARRAEWTSKGDEND